MERLLRPSTVLGSWDRAEILDAVLTFPKPASLGTRLGDQGRWHQTSDYISNLPTLAERQVFKQKEQPETQGCMPRGEGSASWFQWGEHRREGAPEESWGSAGV